MSESNDETPRTGDKSSEADQAQAEDGARTGEEQAEINLENDPPA